jgi:choline-sulfatase
LELHNLVPDDTHGSRVREFEMRLKNLLDPQKVDASAKTDQAKLVRGFGGIDSALRSGTRAETPAPKV